MWPSAGDLIAVLVQDVYDWDTLVLAADSQSELPHALILCQGGLPCALAVEGGGNRSIVLRGQGSIVCLGSNLCTAVQLANILAVQCEGDSRPVVEADGTVLNLSNTTFSACASSEDGGAIRAYGDAQVAISDCLFIGCRSAGSGGAVSAVGATLTVWGSAFANCSAEGAGGAIYGAEMLQYPSGLFPVLMLIGSSRFDSCRSGATGGAVSLSSGKMTMVSSNITGCISDDAGGAVSAVGDSDISVSYSAFMNNAANGAGGGVFSIVDSVSLLAGIVCEANTAAYGGGGVLLWNGDYPPAFVCGAGAFDSRNPATADSPDGPVCVFCPSGTFQSGFGMTSASDCSACEAGSYASEEGGSVCVACPPGSFSTSSSATALSSCSACEAGKYQPTGGHTSSKLCDVGTYTSQISAYECSLCAAGMYLPATGASSAVMCSQCMAGTFSVAGSSACTACLPGSYMTRIGSVSNLDCLPCAAGTYSSNFSSTGCGQCIAGTFSLSGSSTCETCDVGTYSNLNTAAECKSCEFGTFASAYGSTSCTVCAAGLHSSFKIQTTFLSCSSIGSVELCPQDVRSVCSADCAHGVIGRYVQSGTYNANEGVTWVIGADTASSVTLRFTHFKTEPIYDTLTLYNCSNTSCTDATLITTLSGLSLPLDQVSTSGVMQIVWSSDTCCPKRTSCYCDDPTYVFMLSGWQAVYEVAGARDCSSSAARREVRTSSSTMIGERAPNQLPYVDMQRAPNQLSSVDMPSSPQRSNSLSQGINEIRPITLSYMTNGGGSLLVAPIMPISGFVHGTRSLQQSFDAANSFHSVSVLRSITNGLSLQHSYKMCGTKNTAIYGRCLASSYKALYVQGIPTNSLPAHPGLPFSLIVAKKDFYGQTIATDSSSLLQTLSALDSRLMPDHAVSLSGTIITNLQEGEGAFSVSIKPTFTTVDAERGVAIFKTRPAIYFKGLDAEEKTLSTMESELFSVAMPSGSAICPPGFILLLDQQQPGSPGRGGVCSQC